MWDEIYNIGISLGSVLKRKEDLIAVVSSSDWIDHLTLFSYHFNMTFSHLLEICLKVISQSLFILLKPLLPTPDYGMLLVYIELKKEVILGKQGQMLIRFLHLNFALVGNILLEETKALWCYIWFVANISPFLWDYSTLFTLLHIGRWYSVQSIR